MSVRTLNELFYRVVERGVDRALLVKRRTGPPGNSRAAAYEAENWTPISSRELYRDVVGVARALESWGVGKGDRVAILSENRPEWAVADFATMLLGAVTTPIYSTLTPEQTLYLLRDSGARVIFVSSHDHLRKLNGIKDQCAIERIVLMDDGPIPPGVIAMQRLMENGPGARDAAFDTRALAVAPDDLATIIYTSGTTGTPKGAMLTHGNLACNLLHSYYLYPYQCGQVGISFMPLSHVFARHVDYVNFLHGVTVAYCSSPDELSSAMKEVKPHAMVAVPRVFEKMRGKVRAKFDRGWKRKLYEWALGVGREHREEILAGRIPSDWRWRLANKLLFSKIRAALGGEVELFISGGAPLSREVLDWYASIGIRVMEGYGMTETAPIIAVNNPNTCRCGSVGPVIRNIEVRIGADDEILVKGPSVFKGYWNMPQETAAVFEGEWFRTGDVGRLDEDGFLYITDRKKDLIKTSGGKFIAPQPIEGKLKNNLLVAEAALIADGRKFPSAVMAPNFPVLEDWARQNHMAFASRQELVTHPKVLALYEDILSALNKDLARFEQIKKFILVPEEFSIADGTLTPTMKVKRRAIEQRYRLQLDALYADEVYGTDTEVVKAG